MFVLWTTLERYSVSYQRNKHICLLSNVIKILSFSGERLLWNIIMAIIKDLVSSPVIQSIACADVTWYFMLSYGNWGLANCVKLMILGLLLRLWVIKCSLSLNSSISCLLPTSMKPWEANLLVYSRINLKSLPVLGIHILRTMVLEVSQYFMNS